jgi:hypothetical protein
MQRLASAGGLVAFVGRVVEPGTLVRATAPGRLVAPGRAGVPDRAGAGPDPPAAVERALAGWLRATHQGATSPAQLDWYLDEFTFRFNRRASTHRGLLFYRLLEEAVVTPPVPTAGSSGAAPSRAAVAPAAA